MPSRLLPAALAALPFVPPAVLEGGFRATRARIVQGESGFTLAGEEPVLVALAR
jgi:hypothetical protein